MPSAYRVSRVGPRWSHGLPGVCCTAAGRPLCLSGGGGDCFNAVPRLTVDRCEVGRVLHALPYGEY
jgi:hypothetical protein